MLLLYDGSMRGVGFRPRIAVQPQPILCGSDGVGETRQSALSPGRINIARAYWGHTGYVLLARALMGLSWQLPILQLRPMHGHRERYCFLLRDQSPVLVRAPAARRLSGPILSGVERRTLRSLTSLNPGDAEIRNCHGCSRLSTNFFAFSPGRLPGFPLPGEGEGRPSLSEVEPT